MGILGYARWGKYRIPVYAAPINISDVTNASDSISRDDVPDLTSYIDSTYPDVKINYKIDGTALLFLDDIDAQLSMESDLLQRSFLNGGSGYAGFFRYSREDVGWFIFGTPIAVSGGSATRALGGLYNLDRNFRLAIYTSDTGTIHSMLVRWKDGYTPSSYLFSDSSLVSVPYPQLKNYIQITDVGFIPTALVCTNAPTLRRGESSTLNFVVTDDAGNSAEVSGVNLSLYTDYGDSLIITDQTVTVSENCTYSSIVVRAKYTLDEEYVTYVTVTVTNATTPYSPGGTTSPGQTGGNGNFGKGEVSDNISNNIPSGSAYGEGNSTGMFTRYLMNPAGLSSIGEWLWSTDLGLNIAQTIISKLYGDPAEALISLMSYPFDIVQLTGVTRQQQNIFWGNYDSNVPGIALKSQAGQFDWGEIELKPYWGSFLDYSPHTKVELYLPWSTGFVELDPNQVLPSNPEAGTVGKIRIKTNVDLNKGSCLHIVSNQDNCVIGCFAGQCGMQVPLFSTDYASKAAGIVMGAAGMAIGATVTAGANAAAAEAGYEKWHLAHKNPQATQALGRDMPASIRQGVQMAKADRSTEFNVGSTISDESSRSLALLRTPGHFARNGGFTDGSAGLGIQYPYIIVSRPQQSVPQGYADHFGFPSNYYGRLGAWGGYTEVGEIHLNGLDATAPELAELEAILKGGIIV